MATGPRRSDPPLAAAVRAALTDVGDPARAAAYQRYMKSALPFRGLAMPELRAVLRPLLADPGLAPADRAEWERAVRALWDEPEVREERYAALAVAGHRAARPWQDPDALPLYRYLVQTGAWWDLVDAVAPRRVGPILRASPESVTPLIRAWAADDDLWVRRAAILAQLGHGADTDTELLSDVLALNLEGSLHGREFFVRKAVGWALRQYARTDPEWVRAWVAAHASELSGLSRREALKHLDPG